MGIKGLIQRTQYPLTDDQLTIISKRLYQCLYPSLPHGLHSITLEIYGIILKKSTPKHIFLLSSGLFQHFQYCAPQNKLQFLTLISENYLNNPGLGILTSGLIACLLSGAGDKQETLNKIIEMLEGFQNKDALHNSI